MDRAGRRDAARTNVRRSGLTRVAVLVCTRGRQAELAACLASLGAQEVPAGVRLAVVVADNNEPPDEAAIGSAARKLGLDLHYGHEPQRGYCHVRNRAIELALRSGAELLIFLDDDSEALPGLVTAHLAAIERYDADAIVGTFEGLESRAREGALMKKAGTGNVSLLRWVVDENGGASLRFDPRLNLLGFEDHEFFRDLTRLGGKIVRSVKALARDERSPRGAGSATVKFAGEATEQERACAFVIMEGRNEIVAARLRHGVPVALARLALRHTPLLGRGTAAYVQSLAFLPLDPAKARILRERGKLSFLKVRAAIGGFRGPGYDRPLSKQGHLVEVDGTAT